jgi:hypothetical protein
MPCDYSQYPKNWRNEIRPAILRRAEHCCEHCGIHNYLWIIRSRANSAKWLRIGRILEKRSSIMAQYRAQRWNEVGYHKPVKIVLTVAHLDHDITNNDHSNLAAL